MLGLAAGSLGLGPGDTPRDGFFDADYLREHGGLVGESLFWASAHAVLRGRVAHPVRVPAAGRRAAADRRVDRRPGAGHARRGDARPRERVRRSTRDVRRTRRRAGSAAAAIRCPATREPVEPPEPEDQEPVVRATHVEAPALDAAERYPDLYERGAAGAGARSRSREPSPSRWSSPSREPRPPSEDATSDPVAGGAHADGQPPLGGHRGGRLRLPAAAGRRS